MDLFNFRSNIPAKREVNSSNETGSGPTSTADHFIQPMARRSRRTEDCRDTKPAQDNDRQIHRPVVHGLFHMPGGRSEHFEPFEWACWAEMSIGIRDLNWTRTRKSNQLARLKFAGRGALLVQHSLHSGERMCKT